MTNVPWQNGSLKASHADQQKQGADETATEGKVRCLLVLAKNKQNYIPKSITESTEALESKSTTSRRSERDRNRSRQSIHPSYLRPVRRLVSQPTHLATQPAISQPVNQPVKQQVTSELKRVPTSVSLVSPLNLRVKKLTWLLLSRSILLATRAWARYLLTRSVGWLP